MRRLLFGSSLVAMAFLCLNAFARAQDEARAVIEKAAKAHGVSAVDAARPVHSKIKGTIELMGMTLPFTGDSLVNPPKHMKVIIQLEIMGQQITSIQVLNGDKAWANVLGQTMELEGPQLNEMKEQMYGTEVGYLWPLLKKDNKFTLSPLGEVQVDGKPAVGVKVTSDGHRDVDLYFDKETSMLVKTESRTLHPITMQEVPAQSYFKEYKDVDGRKEPRKLVVNLDGQKYAEIEILESKILDKADENEFAKP
jgi:hypothetical protein